MGDIIITVIWTKMIFVKYLLQYDSYLYNYVNLLLYKVFLNYQKYYELSTKDLYYFWKQRNGCFLEMLPKIFFFLFDECFELQGGILWLMQCVKNNVGKVVQQC